MPGISSSEQTVAAYFESNRLTPERFARHETRKSRTPDFRVLQGDAFLFFCEVKNAQEDRWLDEQGKDAEPRTLYGGSRHDPVYNRVANYIHTAAGQFAAVNPDGAYPNVLAIVNEDRRAGFQDLCSVVTGNFYSDDGPPDPIFRNMSEGRIREDRFRIDLYLWFDSWRTGPPHMGFTQANPAHDGVLRRYFGVKPERIKQLAAAHVV